MASVLTKSEYAAHAGVKPAAVSNWIARQKLTAPAVRRDGKIDVRLADEQLGRTVDPSLSAASSRRYMAEGATNGETPGWTPSNQVNFQLLRARALSASVDAERKRRDLNEERGRYLLREQAEAEWAAVMTGFLTNVEASLVDLVEELEGLDRRERLVRVRRWWRDLRAREAEANQVAADVAPEFIAETAA